MNIKSLSMALRNKATELSSVAAEPGEVDATTAKQDQTLRDAAELIRVLARLVEGRPIAKAFGAPVDQTTLIEQYRSAAADHRAAAWDCSTCGRRK